MVNYIVSFISVYALLLLVHRNARNFCALILYPVSLPDSLMSFSSFLVASLGFSTHHLQIVSVLFLLFQFVLFNFLFFSDCHGQDFQTMLKAVKVYILVLYPILGEIVFHHWECLLWVHVCVHVYDLYYVEVHSLYAHFLESFYHKWVLNFIKRFFYIIELYLCFLCFYYIYFYSDLYCLVPFNDFGFSFFLLLLVALGIKLGSLLESLLVSWSEIGLL